MFFIPQVVIFHVFIVFRPTILGSIKNTPSQLEALRLATEELVWFREHGHKRGEARYRWSADVKPEPANNYQLKMRHTNLL